jgi:phosphate:Na+ symporter
VSTPLPLIFLLHVAAAAALLLWSVRLVRTGMERAFAHALRRGLRRADAGRLRAAATGTVAALLLQSSTAVALLVAGFLGSGALAPATGLAALLGADLGSAIVAQLLMLRPAWITPVLILAGVALFLRGTGRARPVGRILIGLALIFVSLDMIADAAALLPTDLLASLGGYLARDLATAFLVGAVLAWAMHSSVATVLLAATLAGSGAFGGPAAIATVLGANLGGALIPLVLTFKSDAATRRVVAANLLLRGGGAAAALWLFAGGLLPADPLGSSPQAQALAAHVAYNGALLLIALPLAGLLPRLMAFLIPDPAATPDLATTALDPAALADPARALGCARREILRMGEETLAMLRAVLPLYRAWDDGTAEAILAREARVDAMHFGAKLYLSRLMRDGPEDTQDAAADLVTLAAQIEASGDEVSSTLLALARRVHDDGRTFSDEGWRELTDFHDRVTANTQLALDVIMRPDIDTARALMEEKDALRRVEERLQLSHLARLRSGLAESVETSNIHQETLRSLKQVNAAFATAAHPILKGAGEILPTRLAPPDRVA